MKSIRKWNAALFLVNGALVLGAVHWLGCAGTQQQQQQPRSPGLYDLKGWAYSGVWWPGSGTGTATAVDIDGTVGHPLTIYGPTGSTSPNGAPWSYNYRIDSGQLPPGLAFDTPSYSAISGIPTERGHWIIQLEVYNLQLTTPYFSYAGFTQQLRIHITGSGEVNE